VKIGQCCLITRTLGQSYKHGWCSMHHGEWEKNLCKKKPVRHIIKYSPNLGFCLDSWMNLRYVQWNSYNNEKIELGLGFRLILKYLKNQNLGFFINSKDHTTLILTLASCSTRNEMSLAVGSAKWDNVHYNHLTWTGRLDNTDQHQSHQWELCMPTRMRFLGFMWSNLSYTLPTGLIPGQCQ